MTARPPQVAALLLGSGSCALVYQIAWERELAILAESYAELRDPRAVPLVEGAPLASRAEAELRQFLAAEPLPFGAGLAPPTAGPERP